MMTYEITATVRPDLVSVYERFMRERHIPDLLATGHFTAASLGRSRPGRYRIRYEARTRESLDRYLAEDAPRLRAHLQSEFPDGIEVAREEWEIVESWTRVEVKR
jgi:uncharacterized protein DUF4286